MNPIKIVGLVFSVLAALITLVFFCWRAIWHVHGPGLYSDAQAKRVHGRIIQHACIA